MPETLYLVDGSSILYRAFFAIRNLSTRDGKPTNAIFGTVKMAQKLLKERAPSHIAFVFDTPAPTFRHEAFEEYKANRPEMPDEMAQQVRPAKEILRAMGLAVTELAGFEADDLIGTLARRATEAGMAVVIVTADKDLFQLVRPGVRVLHTKKEDALLDAEGVEELFGVPPERVVDVLALWGDPTDNIPGVPGIGEKGAKELVKQYGSLEEVLAHASEVSRKAYREGLLQHADQARFSRELATVKCDVDLPYGPEDLRLREPDRARLSALFAEHQFTSLLDERPAPQVTVLTADREPYGEGAVSALQKAQAAGLTWEGDALWLSDGQKSWPCKKQDLTPEMLARLPLCAHDLKPLLRRLGPREYEPGEAFVDAAVAGYMLDPSARVPAVPALAETFLGVRCAEQDRAGEALCLARLRAPLAKKLADLGMESLYFDVERPLVAILARMEVAGVKVDVPYFRQLSQEMAGTLSGLETEIHAAAGLEFNVASPKQVGEVLFENLNLPVQKRTSKTKSYSTDGEVLEALRGAHPVVPLILEHRLLSKLKGTYADPLPGWADPETHRVHAVFNQTVAATGRLSSSDPNLQNIPARGEWGPRIRRGFVAEEDRRLVGADYSQIELRVLAHMSADPSLIRVFERGEDIHTATASEVFDVAPAFVTPDMRRQAKAVNFGILYGMGPFGLSRELGVPQKEAKAFIERYFARFPKVKAFLDGVQEQVLAREETVTLLGRRRLFPGIAGAPKPVQAALLRQAVNMPVQGSAADLIKKAMVAVDPGLPAQTRLILQVHDELIVEAPEPQAPEAGRQLQVAMERAMALRVPLTVCLSSGRRWDELK
jgi:DNA polymerase-1